SAVRQRFPKLMKLDGQELPPPIAFDLEAPTTLPPTREGYFPNDEIKSLILRFLTQLYYGLFSSWKKHLYFGEYHMYKCNCKSSNLKFPFVPSCFMNKATSDQLKDYFQCSKLSLPVMRQKLLKHTRLNVVAFLNELPHTQHDLPSFVIDVSVHLSTCFTLSTCQCGCSAEGKCRESVRAFSRVFLAVPAANGGLCIVNDQLFVRNASTEEIRRAFVMPAPTPSSSPVPTLTPLQQEMLQAFSTQSGMNLEWSQ
uniref:NTF2 domain-containing protein n=1 Tax=Petromyzon marinus TaxID=7757 RepID=S4RWB7_PETMA